MDEKKKKVKEWEVEWSDQVKEQAAKDPEAARYLREFGAIVRQALAGVESGQYQSFDDAMEAITGNRPEIVDLDECDPPNDERE